MFHDLYVLIFLILKVFGFLCTLFGFGFWIVGTDRQSRRAGLEVMIIGIIFLIVGLILPLPIFT